MEVPFKQETEPRKPNSLALDKLQKKPRIPLYGTGRDFVRSILEFVALVLEKEKRNTLKINTYEYTDYRCPRLRGFQSC